MRTETVVKLIVVALLLLFLYKKGLPWWKGRETSKSHSAATATDEHDCAAAAAAASEKWGSGLSQFSSPTPDLGAWSSFRSSVDSAISSATHECAASSESCVKGREAMQELSKVVADFDSAIRAGNGVPNDVVQHQESIDNLIDRARELQREGK
jgi:hypothetical protein